MFSSAILIKTSKCVCLSVCLLSVSLLLDSFPAHKSHVSTRHFASLLSYCDVQRNATLTFCVASRMLQSVPGLADPSPEICDPHGVACKCALTSCRHFAAAALLSSSGAQRTRCTLPQLYYTATNTCDPITCTSLSSTSKLLTRNTTAQLCTMSRNKED